MAFFLISFFSAFKAHASVSAINNIKIRINASDDGFCVGSLCTPDNLEITEMGHAHFQIESEEFSFGTSEYVTAGEYPVLELFLQADTGYKFGTITSSGCVLTGDMEPIFVKAQKEEYNDQITLFVRLSGIMSQPGNVENAYWEDSGSAVVTGFQAGRNVSFDIILYKDGELVTRKRFPQGTERADLSMFMASSGKYTFDIREINSETGKSGEWYSSNSVYTVNDELSYYISEYYRDTAYVTPDPTGWQKDEKGWWYSFPGGDYAKDRFVNDKGKTYYLDSDGYMVTGWMYIGGAWYYFDESGAMMKDGLTPDGYYVDSEGKMTA